jgi:Uri superfamily endonuclease
MTKGIYALILEVKKKENIKIGKVKEYVFLPGPYIYVGSALGTRSNNVENRLKRHFSSSKKNFWHVDYLLANPEVEPVQAFYAKTDEKMECKLSAQLAKCSRLISFKGFGNSDCLQGCKTHLYYFDNAVDLVKIINSAFKAINLEPKSYKKIE